MLRAPRIRGVITKLTSVEASSCTPISTPSLLNSTSPSTICWATWATVADPDARRFDRFRVGLPHRRPSLPGCHSERKWFALFATAWVTSSPTCLSNPAITNGCDRPALSLRQSFATSSEALRRRTTACVCSIPPRFLVERRAKQRCAHLFAAGQLRLLRITLPLVLGATPLHHRHTGWATGYVVSC